MNKIPAADINVYPVFKALGQNGEINALVVSRDGKTAYIGGSDGSVVVSTLFKPDAKNNQGSLGKVLWSRKLIQSGRPIDALALSPDEKELAVAQFSNVSIVDLESGAVANAMTQISGRVLSLAWDPRGEILLMGRASGEVFGWRLSGTPFAGQDSQRAIEQYGQPGGTSVIRLAFHPSGRAFIAAHRDGEITLWRLLRTERELGIRDEEAEIDLERRGSKDVVIGRTGAVVEDIWLDGAAQEIFVAVVNGKVSHWRLRGIQAGEELVLGTDSVGSIQGLDLKRRAGGEVRFLVASGRGQQVKAFCREAGMPTLGAENAAGVPIEVSKKDDDENEEEGTRIVDGRLIVATTAPKAPAAEKAADSSARLVAESVVLQNPVSQLRSGGSMLWGTQKNGNLLVFDARPVLSAVADKCPVS